MKMDIYGTCTCIDRHMPVYSRSVMYMYIFLCIDTATVADLIGLTFWKYMETTKDPVELVCQHLPLHVHVHVHCNKRVYLINVLCVQICTCTCIYCTFYATCVQHVHVQLYTYPIICRLLIECVHVHACMHACIHLRVHIYAAFEVHVVKLLLPQRAVNNYAIMIAEDDGDIDMDLPRKEIKIA